MLEPQKDDRQHTQNKFKNRNSAQYKIQEGIENQIKSQSSRSLSLHNFKTPKSRVETSELKSSFNREKQIESSVLNQNEQIPILNIPQDGNQQGSVETIDSYSPRYAVFQNGINQQVQVNLKYMTAILFCYILFAFLSLILIESQTYQTIYSHSDQTNIFSSLFKYLQDNHIIQVLFYAYVIRKILSFKDNNWSKIKEKNQIFKNGELKFKILTISIIFLILFDKSIVLLVYEIILNKRMKLNYSFQQFLERILHLMLYNTFRQQVDFEEEAIFLIFSLCNSLLKFDGNNNNLNTVQIVLLYTLIEGNLKGFISHFNENKKEQFNLQFDSESIQNLTELMSEGSKSIFRVRADLQQLFQNKQFFKKSQFVGTLANVYEIQHTQYEKFNLQGDFSLNSIKERFKSNIDCFINYQFEKAQSFDAINKLRDENERNNNFDKKFEILVKNNFKDQEKQIYGYIKNLIKQNSWYSNEIKMREFQNQFKTSLLLIQSIKLNNCKLVVKYSFYEKQNNIMNQDFQSNYSEFDLDLTEQNKKDEVNQNQQNEETQNEKKKEMKNSRKFKRSSSIKNIIAVKLQQFQRPKRSMLLLKRKQLLTEQSQENNFLKEQELIIQKDSKQIDISQFDNQINQNSPQNQESDHLSQGLIEIQNIEKNQVEEVKSFIETSKLIENIQISGPEEKKKILNRKMKKQFSFAEKQIKSSPINSKSISSQSLHSSESISIMSKKSQTNNYTDLKIKTQANNSFRLQENIFFPSKTSYQNDEIDENKIKLQKIKQSFNDKLIHQSQITYNLSQRNFHSQEVRNEILQQKQSQQIVQNKKFSFGQNQLNLSNLEYKNQQSQDSIEVEKLINTNQIVGQFSYIKSSFVSENFKKTNLDQEKPHKLNQISIDLLSQSSQSVSNDQTKNQIIHVYKLSPQFEKQFSFFDQQLKLKVKKIEKEKDEFSDNQDEFNEYFNKQQSSNQDDNQLIKSATFQDFDDKFKLFGNKDKILRQQKSIENKEYQIKKKQSNQSNRDLYLNLQKRIQSIKSKQSFQSKEANCFLQRSYTINDMEKQRNIKRMLKTKNASSEYLSQVVEKYENKLEQKKAGLDYFKKKTKKLEQNLENNKIFLNMVVHDMRNPTNQVEFLLKETLKWLLDFQIQLQEINKKNKKNNKKFKRKNESPQDRNIQNQINPIIIQEQGENQQNEDIRLDMQQELNFASQNIRLNLNQLSLNLQNNLSIQNQIAISQRDAACPSIGINLNGDIEEQDQQIQEQNIQIEQIFEQPNQILVSDNGIIQIEQQIMEIHNQNPLNTQINCNLEIKEAMQNLQYRLKQIEDAKNVFYQNLNSNKIQDNNQSELNEREDDFPIVGQEPKISKQKAKNLHISHDKDLMNLETPYLDYFKIPHHKKQIRKVLRYNQCLQLEIVSPQQQAQVIANQIQEESKVQENNRIIQRANVQIQTEEQLLEAFLQKTIDLSYLIKSINFIESCKYSSTMLLNLINDMMDLAKTEKMTFELNNEFFDLTKTVKRSFENLAYYGQQKQIEPQFFIDDKILPFFINFKGDEGRFTQIFLNFLSNAFKFTPNNGNISIEIKPIRGIVFCQQIFKQKNELQNDNQIVENQNEDENNHKEYFVTFEIRIKDSGMGISLENQSKLFLNFSKLADTQGVNKQGTGLGLSICKHIIEKMGGKVKIESEQGKGTTFVIIMSSISRVKINDSISIQKDLSLNRDSCFSNEKQQPSQQKKDQVIIENSIDISPSSNKSRDRVKLQQAFKQNIQIQDSSNSNNNKLRIYSHFSQQKSIDLSSSSEQSQIQENISCSEQEKEIQLENEQSNLQDDDIENVDDFLKKLKVLVINDEHFILQMQIFMLQNASIKEIETAQNGFEGFNMVCKKQYDLVICDLTMPVMDGFECCQRIQQQYNDQNLFFQNNIKTKYCPYLVACSAFVNKPIYDQAIVSGFDIVVQSPLNAQIIQETILIKLFENIKQKRLNYKNKIFNKNQNLNNKQELIKIEQKLLALSKAVIPNEISDLDVNFSKAIQILKDIQKSILLSEQKQSEQVIVTQKQLNNQKKLSYLINEQVKKVQLIIISFREFKFKGDNSLDSPKHKCESNSQKSFQRLPDVQEQPEFIEQSDDENSVSSESAIALDIKPRIIQQNIKSSSLRLNYCYSRNPQNVLNDLKNQ